MKSKWIPVALLVATLIPGCKSDREVLSGVSDTPPTPPVSTDTTTGASAPASAKPPKVDPSKFTTTPSGLKYAILKPGKGPDIKTHQQAVVHYTGWLQSDETKFDSSRDRGEPYEIVIDESQVIKGWHEGIKGMKAGEQRLLVIPPALAYREEGRPPVIPGNATLIFDIELIKIGEHSH